MHFARDIKRARRRCGNMPPCRNSSDQWRRTSALSTNGPRQILSTVDAGPIDAAGHGYIDAPEGDGECRE
jgi:hypothetical protein